jgi:exodeoxyribonuclease V alpha subunit
MINNTLTNLYHNEIINLTDLYFARFIASMAGGNNPEVLLAVSLASQATFNKHVCLDLESIAGRLLVGQNSDGEAIRCPEISKWLEKLKKCPAVGRTGSKAPLILDERNRLYLYRYWEYEQILARKIIERIGSSPNPVDGKILLDSLKRLFPQTRDGEMDMDPQRIAALVACLRNFCIITGGPGTGKTTTVAKILALLLEQPGKGELRILLAAPTGKSAIRLGEAISGIKDGLDCSTAVKISIPVEAMTLHRLLKTVPGSPYFRYNQDRPLPADVVVVDEASMVDAALMSKLIQAVPENARLILIGDKDQLASVEAGSILGDICGGGGKNEFTPQWSHTLNLMARGFDFGDSILECPSGRIGDCIVTLDRSYRFSEGKYIEALSRAINAGDAEKALQLAESGLHDGLTFNKIDSQAKLIDALEPVIISEYKDYISAKNPVEALKHLNDFKILCAVKKGGFGVEGINRIAEFILKNNRLIDPSAEWYDRRPVMIQKNDYSSGLFNGDIGVTWHESGSPVYVYFQTGDEEVMRLSPFRLPEHETAFAMTVHKSQGSEFESVLLLLPDKDSPVLTRELLYTGVTRAKRKIGIWDCGENFSACIQRTLIRHSGLRDILWKDLIIQTQ